MFVRILALACLFIDLAFGQAKDLAGKKSELQQKISYQKAYALQKRSLIDNRVYQNHLIELKMLVSDIQEAKDLSTLSQLEKHFSATKKSFSELAMKKWAAKRYKHSHRRTKKLSNEDLLRILKKKKEELKGLVSLSQMRLKAKKEKFSEDNYKRLMFELSGLNSTIDKEDQIEKVTELQEIVRKLSRHIQENE